MDVSVTMSKRPTSIADFLASPVRLNVSMTPFSVFRALFILKALLLPRRLTDEQCVFPVEVPVVWSVVCSCILHSSLLSSSAILAHCNDVRQ